ncbi:MAG: hypothetical protein F4210_17000, partial [Holophagales bacterium]|nr:hypothetical protein [Holophagales bacterium]
MPGTRWNAGTPPGRTINGTSGPSAIRSCCTPEALQQSAPMHRVLIADSLAPAGVEVLRQNAEVDELRDADRPRLAELIADYDAVIVRSGTQITREVLEGGDRLKVVGRAGVGVD